MSQLGARSSGLTIRNGQIVTAKRQYRADIRIRGERIIEIGHDLTPVAGEREIDAHELLVLPGGIDPHVHLTVPGPVPAAERWVDDLESGSQAALAGGITTLGNISFPLPGETPLATVEREAGAVKQQAIADLMLHPVLLPPIAPALRILPQLVAEGCTTIKIFMSMQAFDDHADEYLAALRACAASDILALIHCEDQGILSTAVRHLLAKGQGSLRYYAESRPVAAEVAATRRAVAMAEESGAALYVVHLSSEQALRVCEDARAQSLPVYVETRPLYLHFTRERYHHLDGPLYVGQPPLRQAHDVAALWEGLARGAIDTIATDHAPWTRQQKLDPTLNITRLRPGVNNLQVMLPLLYSEGVRQGRLSLERFVAVTSTNAARLFGLYPQKGTIAVGSDADLVLWAPAERRRIEGSMLFSRAGFSIFEGTEVTGWPQMTIRRGQIVFKEGRITAQPGSGQFLRRGRWQAPTPQPSA
jgi:dihydropyrimidinase